MPEFPAGEVRLMRKVKQSAGPMLARLAASNAAPESFWAALTAGESGIYFLRGLAPREFPPRFEPAVYRHLKQVAAGQAKSYGEVTEVAEAIDPLLAPRTGAFHSAFLTAEFAAAHAQGLAALEDWALRKLASSWGFTQVMGYHVTIWGDSIDDLLDPEAHYGYAAYLMAEFCRNYRLDPRADWEPMARCWNTGRPAGKTYDPNYVSNLLRRKRIWEEMA